jgi:hypothetical protein
MTLSLGKNRRRAAMILGLCLVGQGLGGCGGAASLKTDETLAVVMYGTFIAPVDATGNAEPRSQTYTLKDVAVMTDDGAVTSVMTEKEPVTLKIVNRSQIIESASLHDFVDKTLTGVRVTFDTAITGAGKYEPEMAVALASADAELLQGIDIDTGKNVRLNIKVQWKNTVTRDDTADPPTESMTAPTFALDIGDD